MFFFFALCGLRKPCKHKTTLGLKKKCFWVLQPIWLKSSVVDVRTEEYKIGPSLSKTVFFFHFCNTTGSDYTVFKNLFTKIPDHSFLSNVFCLIEYMELRKWNSWRVKPFFFLSIMMGISEQNQNWSHS